ncbi:MAG: sulfur carrier protein ThiS [bacterium]
MKIKLNGETYQTEALTVEGLLEELRITPGRVAVELNLEIVKKTDYQLRGLKEGDRVEIVNFVGGG